MGEQMRLPGAPAAVAAGADRRCLRRATPPRSPIARARAGLLSVAVVAGLAAVLSALFAGFVNYDTFFGLVWGHELAAGGVPRFDLPVAPTPKPLTNALGLVLSPFGHGGEALVVIGAFAALGGLGLVVYRLGEVWFSPAVGLLAAAIVLTREPVISYGARAYVDIPFMLLVLGAVLVETKRPRAGLAVVVPLAIAGLLRPEAWMLSLAYLAWLLLDRPFREVGGLALVALLAPALWVMGDLLGSGDPLFSLRGTRETAQLLERPTGLDDLPVIAARRFGEILREPVLVGAAGGALLALVHLRARARLLAGVGVVALASFALLAVAGLPLLTRYLLLPAAVAAIFCAVGVLGWRHVTSPLVRRAWAAFGAIVMALLLAFGPAQFLRLERLGRSLDQQRTIRADLHQMSHTEPLSAGCAPVSVPNHRLVPLLALWLDREPAEVTTVQTRRERSGAFIAASGPEVERAFLLDPNDPARFDADVPAGFSLAADNRSWRVYTKGCREGGRVSSARHGWAWDTPAASSAGGA